MSYETTPQTDTDNIGKYISYLTDTNATSIFKTQYGTHRSENANDETNNGISLVITAGYVDPTQQIQSMLMAGERLNSFRMYDDEEALSNEDYAKAIAQIRHPNTDISEIETYTDSINARLQEAKSTAERKAIEQSLDRKTGGTYKSYDEKQQEQAPDVTDDET